MAEERVQRRLAAILAADVVGYSRLMETDETGTLAALKARRRDVLDPLVAEHRGRTFKTAGDGVLIEFASAVNAVQCAVDLQQGMAAANGAQPEDRHIVLRIGVNLGDVIVEGGAHFGDGVNIAARLEALADPGGILVSGTAFDHIKSNVKAGFDDLGVQKLKNIAEPVRAYRVTGIPTMTVAAPRTAPDKPSIAVLPFTNMSGDPEQEYFSDGITEDIITELSRFRSLFVIARNSSFQYRDRAVDVRRVARELGVQFIVEGSIRKLGNNLRITAQLIDATTGNHLWAERFDCALDGIFAVQDEVVRKIVARLEGRIATSIAEQARRKPTQSMAAYECVLRGIKYLRGYGPDDNKHARELFQRAMDLDPDYALARAYRALTEVIVHDYNAPAAVFLHAVSLASTAIDLDDSDSRCHWVLGTMHQNRGNLDSAERYLQRAIALNPNDANAIASFGRVLVSLGHAEKGIEHIRAAMRLNPYHPDWYLIELGSALYVTQRYAAAVEVLTRMARPGFWTLCYLAACYAQMGRMEEAANAMAEARQRRPDFSIAKLRFSGLAAPEADHIIEGMRKAGLPE
jgi:TolB-like protein/cytochrome c-type biogenesis protein CcmH/NrfG